MEMLDKKERIFGVYFFRSSGKKMRAAIRVSETCTAEKLSDAIYRWVAEDENRVIKMIGHHKGKEMIESFLARQVDYIQVREFNHTVPTDKMLLLKQVDRENLLHYLKSY